jgi:hypothetical protein
VKMTEVPSATYYDPSYGVIYPGSTPTDGANSFEANAVEGYVRQFPEDSFSPGLLRLRDASGQHNIVFDK